MPPLSLPLPGFQGALGSGEDKPGPPSPGLLISLLTLPHLALGLTGAATRLHTHTDTRRHTHSHIHTHTHSQSHTHIHTHSHIHTHALTHTHIHTHIHNHTHIHTLTHSHTRSHTHIHTHVHNHTFTHTHTHTHSHTRSHTHSHTQILQPSLGLFPPGPLSPGALHMTPHCEVPAPLQCRQHLEACRKHP